MTQPHYIDREAVALLPCPFCGGGAEVGNDGARPDDGYRFVRCTGVGCGQEIGWEPSADKAIAEWNRRPAPMEAVAWREKVARIVDPAAFMFSPGELDDKVYSASRAHAFDRADRILALIATHPVQGGEA